MASSDGFETPCPDSNKILGRNRDQRRVDYFMRYDAAWGQSKTQLGLLALENESVRGLSCDNTDQISLVVQGWPGHLDQPMPFCVSSRSSAQHCTIRHSKTSAPHHTILCSCVAAVQREYDRWDSPKTIVLC